MAYAERVDAQFAFKEVYLGWLWFSLEFGNNPEELARLEKCKWRTGELVFNEVQRKLDIPPGNPFTVAKSIGDYLTRVGYAKFQFMKVSDDEIVCDKTDLVVAPIMPLVRSRGIKVSPQPSDTLFAAALKRLCNMKAESVPLPENLKASTPKGWEREMWRFSPLS